MFIQSNTNISRNKGAIEEVSHQQKVRDMPLKTILYSVIAVGALLPFDVAFGATIPTAQQSNDGRRNEERMHPKLNSFEPLVGMEQLKLERTTDYWLKEAQKFVVAQNEKKLNKNIAKNIIFFLGDGMSVPTLAALRSYLGGEEQSYSFEKFPSVGMAKTYCVNYQVPDSATTATAYLSGVKGNIGTIGVGAKVRHGNCTESQLTSEYTTSIAKWALDAGKSAGLITTTRVTHASPAGCYAHIADRDWEDDAELERDGCDPNEVDDIAKQLMEGEVGSKLQVILGGGRREFRHKNRADEVEGFGKRLDGRDMIEEWLNKSSGTEKRAYVWNSTSLNDIDASKTTHLLGLFDSSHMQYRRVVVDNNLQDQQPSLTEMLTKAIQVLSQNEKGYFLFVEGGLIDIALHYNEVHYAMGETAEFSKAIDYAHRTVNNSDTILLVTADHAHTMTLAGYSLRGHSITGTLNKSEHDNMQYFSMNFANGQGFHVHTNLTGGRVDPEKLNYQKPSFLYPATVPLDYETHGGDDVAVYTSGPWSHLFTGIFEQNAIPEMLAYATCIGDGKKACDEK